MGKAKGRGMNFLIISFLILIVFLLFVQTLFLEKIRDLLKERETNPPKEGE